MGELVNSHVTSQDIFVGCLAIGLGCAALAAGFSGGRWLRWSRMAQGIEQLGGKTAVVVVYSAIGLFLIGVGISLLN
jgi:hypothetical protein